MAYNSTLNPEWRELEGGFVVVLLTLSHFDSPQHMVSTRFLGESLFSQNKTGWKLAPLACCSSRHCWGFTSHQTATTGGAVAELESMPFKRFDPFRHGQSTYLRLIALRAWLAVDNALSVVPLIRVSSDMREQTLPSSVTACQKGIGTHPSHFDMATSRNCTVKSSPP